MLQMLKIKNPDKKYPSNLGLKWIEYEEKILLNELQQNIDIGIIAQNHKRTIGGINARRREIAYKMYIQNCSISEIIEKTKLDEKTIEETIDKKNNKPKDKPKDKSKDKPKDKSKDKPIDKQKFKLENEIIEIKTEIKELKNIITELVEMIKGIYEFEEA